ncbi:Adipocyte plasma membrane-associated protein [Chionoecetes opilio]|uniref:Adipocyte plasma membrane-associated protein n=1 Tax=Chionoecetes opilio TaxID=41210 RepID=A0A8J8WCS2_CHIOP|nr:Adipocyte plasma membrane-associated protein [Chionoecetes opilio]
MCVTGVDETVEHLMLECERYEYARTQMLEITCVGERRTQGFTDSICWVTPKSRSRSRSRRRRGRVPVLSRGCCLPLLDTCGRPVAGAGSDQCRVYLCSEAPVYSRQTGGEKMGLLRRLVWRVLRLLLDLSVLLVVFVLLPGVPPHVTFNAYESLPPALPLEGGLARNTKLNAIERILDGKISGPESIASRKEEEIFVSLHGGKILQLWGPRFDHLKIVTSIGPGCDGPWQEEVCGRPLGLRFGPDGRLLVADAYLGLFSVDVDTGEKEALFDITEEIDGAVARLADDLDVDKHGNIYWSDASTVSSLCGSLVEVLSDPSGRILKFNPKTGANTVLARNIHFANGVQLSPDQDFLLYSETFKFRVHRLWLKGPRAGKTDIFVDQLPGYPDNIRAREGDGYYISLVSIASERNRQVSSALGNLPLVRKLLLRLLMVTKLLIETVNRFYPSVFIEKLAYKTLHLESITDMNLRESNLSMVVEVDEDGRIVGSMQGDSGRIVHISETQKVGNNLFFGSPYNKYLGRLQLNPPTMEVSGKGVRMKVEDMGEVQESVSREADGDEPLEENEIERDHEKDAEVEPKAETKENEGQTLEHKIDEL